jgi:phage repressor protein C with HTH and peptisase S24 domain
MMYDEDSLDELMQLVGAEIEVSGEIAAVEEERLLSWLRDDLYETLSADERETDEARASAFAHRVCARIATRAAERRLPLRQLRYRTAPSIATVSDSLRRSAERGYATLLDLAVAAGAGRELWEEPCEQWLQLPKDIPPSERYLALRVAGDSMSPILEPRDVILIKIDSSPTVNDVIVARIPDQGYVVKRVAGTKNGRIELASFNPAYKPIIIDRHRSSILGTVIARFRHE